MTIQEQIGLETPTGQYFTLAAPGGCIGFSDAIGPGTPYPVVTTFPNACAHYWHPGALVIEPESFVQLSDGTILSFPRFIGPRRFGLPTYDNKPLPQLALACGYTAGISFAQIVPDFSIFGTQIVAINATINPSILTYEKFRIPEDEAGRGQEWNWPTALNVTIRVGGYTPGGGGGGIASDLSSHYTGTALGQGTIERNNTKADHLSMELRAQEGVASDIINANIRITSITWIH